MTNFVNRDTEHMRVGDIIEGNFDEEKTAFVGKCGGGPENCLYLVTYSCVALAKDPVMVWFSDNVNVYINSWVDIEISIKD